MGDGVVLGIYVAEAGSEPMRLLPLAQCIAGVGIEGDRYATGRGYYSARPRLDRQVTLIESEVLDWLRAEHGLEVSGIETRRNILTRGIELTPFVGAELYVGEVRLRVSRVNEPCIHWEGLIGKPVLEPMVHRSGVNCEILIGGPVRPGDAIRAA